MIRVLLTKAAVAAMLLIAAAGCTSEAHAADDFTPAQKYLSAAALAVTVLDWRQTSDIHRHAGMYEMNPLLGRHPTQAEINRYFGLGMLATAAIVYYLPSKYRTAALTFYVVTETAVVGHNVSMGLRVGF